MTTTPSAEQGAPNSPLLIVGIDRDPVSVAALGVARDLCLRLSAWLLVVHVEDLRDRPVDPEGPDWEAEGAAVRSQETAAVHRLMHDHPLGWSYEVRHGSPAQALAQAAQDASALMVVVGHHAGGVAEALHRLVDGSTGQGLLRAGACPVLLVPVP